MKDTRATVFTEWALILSYSKAISYPPRVPTPRGFFCFNCTSVNPWPCWDCYNCITWQYVTRALYSKKSDKKFGFVKYYLYISTVIMRDMIGKLKKTFWVTLLIIGVVLIVSALPLAIKFFFRGFLLLLQHPLEAFCFFGLLTLFITTWIVWEESVEGQKG